MGFVVVTESALGSRPYLKREVRLDRQIFQLRLVGMLSAQRFIH